MRRGLLESHKPIGFLMQERRLETFREIVGCGRELATASGRTSTSKRRTAIWRTYRVFSEHKPIMLITEKFPGTHFPRSSSAATGLNGLRVRARET
jgi:chorismate-pyruvate lyase